MNARLTERSYIISFLQAVCSEKSLERIAGRRRRISATFGRRAELVFTLINLKNDPIVQVLLNPAFQDSPAAKAKVGYLVRGRILFATRALVLARQGRHGQLLAKLLLLRPALTGNDLVTAYELQRHPYAHGFTPMECSGYEKVQCGSGQLLQLSEHFFSKQIGFGSAAGGYNLEANIVSGS